MIVSLGSSFLALKLLNTLHEVHLWLIDHPPLRLFGNTRRREMAISSVLLFAFIAVS